MKEINISTSTHEFRKQNLTSLLKNGQYYDLLKCENCDLEGKQIVLGILQVDGRLKASERCSAKDLPERIKVTTCHAQGEIFSNIISGSIHKVIEPPKGQTNKRGIWVRGVGEPVMLLFGEFTEI